MARKQVSTTGACCIQQAAVDHQIHTEGCNAMGLRRWHHLRSTQEAVCTASGWGRPLV